MIYVCVYIIGERCIKVIHIAKNKEIKFSKNLMLPYTRLYRIYGEEIILVYWLIWTAIIKYMYYFS